MSFAASQHCEWRRATPRAPRTPSTEALRLLGDESSALELGPIYDDLGRCGLDAAISIERKVCFCMAVRLVATRRAPKRSGLVGLASSAYSAEK